MNKKLLLISFLLITAMGCGTTETATREEEEDAADQPIFEMNPDVIESYIVEEMDETDRLLFENRSTLSDRFVTIEQDIPEVFTKDVANQNRFVDEYAGFRVQLLSTRSISVADSTKDNFRAWADQYIEGYTPETYVIFRQPYYKVRVGDFRDQQEANNFSRMIKDEFPDAWVVHDRIEPEYIPADTTNIRKVDL